MLRRGLRRLRRSGESNASADASQGSNLPRISDSRTTSDDGSGAHLVPTTTSWPNGGGSATVATVPNSDGSSEVPLVHSINSVLSVSAGAVQRYCDRLLGGDVSLSSIKLRSQELGNLFRAVDEGGVSEEESMTNTNATRTDWLNKLTVALQQTMCPHVVNVDFSRNHMLPQDVAVLLDATRFSPALRGSLRKLDLSSNIIGRTSASSDVAVVALSNLLSSDHCKLTSLSIYDTALTAVDVQMICNAIMKPSTSENEKELSTLQVLNVGSNSFGAEGVGHVTEVLRVHSGLSWLRLADVAMTEEAAGELKKALERYNTTVKHLDLWNNPAVSVTTVDQIAFLVDANSKGMRHVVVESAADATTIQSTSDKPDDAELSEEDEIAQGRQILKEAMEDSTAEPSAIPVAFLEACTSNFAESQKLGGGAFGEVFAAKDPLLRKRFVVKRIRMDIVENGDSCRLEDVLRGFRRELAALKHFQHPNIATLYAFHLNPQRRGKHYLVFELASNGSLDDFLKNESGRVRLTWDARIHTALDVATALYYLHKGAPGRFECFHRDVKAANICLKRDFTALLIDCGLAKFVPRDDADAGPTLVASSSGGGVFGTLGYICPMYASGRLDDFEGACDIFSFGIVLMELLTGKLQNSVDDGGSDSGSGKRAKLKKLNLYNMYGNVGRAAEIRDLRNDIDELANNAVEAALDEMVELARDCTKEWPADRPTTLEVVQRLRKISRLQAAHNKDEAEEEDEEGPRRPRGTCTVCLVDDLRGMHCHNGSIASSHFLCVDCLKRHIEHYLGKDCIGCPTGCRATPFTDDEIGSISIDLFRRHVLARDRNHSMEKLLQMQEDMLQIQQRVQTQLDDVSRQLNTSLLTLAKLAGGDTTPCPKLVALFPADVKDADEFAKQPKRFFGRKWESKKRFKMYFLCEHSFEPIVPAIDVETTSSWVRDVGPLLKVGYFTLLAAALAGKMYTGVWILPSVDLGNGKGSAAERLDLWDSCINGLCRDDDLILLEQMRADRGIAKESDWMTETQDRMQELVGAAYRLVAEKAGEPQNSGWRESVVPVLNRDGTILWVKREFEAEYYSSLNKTATATATPMATVEGILEKDLNDEGEESKKAGAEKDELENGRDGTTKTKAP